MKPKKTLNDLQIDIRMKPFTELNYQKMVEFGYDEVVYPYKVSMYPKSLLSTLKLIKGQKVTFFISGGLDSSILLALWRKHNLGSLDDLEILTISNDSGNDIVFSKDLLGFLKIPPTKQKIIEYKPTQKFLDEAMIAQGSPMDLGSMQGNWALFQAATHPIIITGDGADEIFGGYNRHKFYDTRGLDVEYELKYYHIPRIVNMARAVNKSVLCPYLSFLPQRKKIPMLEWKSGLEKGVLREKYKEILPSSILYRKKCPLKSASVINAGLSYRSSLVKRWKELNNETLPY